MRNVVVLPDADEAGEAYATAVTGACERAGVSVSVVHLPGLVPHGDVSDWLAAGHRRDELLGFLSRLPRAER